MIDKHKNHFDQGTEADPRQRILEAAYQVFSQKGLQGARTREIAKLAKVNLAMVHYYFQSKEELYIRVLTPIFEQLFESLERALSRYDNSRELIGAVVGAYFDTLKTNPNLPRLMMWELVTGAVALRQIFTNLKGRHRNLLSSVQKIFEDGQRNSTFQLDAFQSIISLVALCVFPFIARPILEIINPGVINWLNFLGRRQQHVLDLLLCTFNEDTKNTLLP